ncbi:hypothetical protein ACQ4PT_062596 [Festuca glaucescens]
MGDWANVSTDLLLSIADRLSLKEKLCIRGVCNAWRCALAPLFPPHLVLTTEFWRTSPLFSAFQHSFLPRLGGRVVGSSNGCFALAIDGLGIFLLNPLTGEEIELLPLKHCVRKVVFAPKPKPNDYTAVALCNGNRIAYINSRRDSKWFILDDVGYGLADLAYDVDGGKVFCLTKYGEVHVLYIPRGRLERPIVKPLLNPAPVFPTASWRTSAKQIFLCNGSLYQVWRNADDDDILVMRYQCHPGRRPCWDAVQDLGGYSVFVGKNNLAVVRAAGVQGVTPNCVYWMGERWGDVPMVFDMATRTYEPCLLPSIGTPLCRSSCWYFFNDNIAAVTGVGTFS